MKIDGSYAELAPPLIDKSFDLLRPLRRINPSLGTHDHHLVDIPDSSRNPSTEARLFSSHNSEADGTAQRKPDVDSRSSNSHSQMQSVGSLVDHVCDDRIIGNEE